MSVQGTRVVVSLYAPETVWSGSFNELEVHRSKDGVDGLYEQLTAPTRRRARLPKSAGDLPSSPVTGKGAALSGKRLSLLLNEITPINITFSGVDPITRASAAIQIAAGSSGKLTSYVDDDGALVVQTVAQDNVTVLRVLQCDAAPLLGLSYDGPDSYAYGKDANVPLISGATLYVFDDAHGDGNAWYKFRYRNSTNNTVSEFQTPKSAAQLPPAGEFVVGYVVLKDEAGRPLANREVIVQVMEDPAKGIAYVTRAWLTDENGKASGPLRREINVVLNIPGTRLNRRILTPADTAVVEFDMLSAGVGEEDAFSVVPAAPANAAVRSFLWPT